MQDKRHVIALLLMAILVIIPRLYRITEPIADWHSWRQVDTAAVARNFSKYGFDMLHPRYDDLSNIQSGKDNPNGWRMVEFPIYQSLAYAGYRLSSWGTIEVWLRVVSIISSVISALGLVMLLRRVSGNIAGYATGIFFAVLPYSIYYGRSTLPEPTAVAFAILAVFFAELATKNGVFTRRIYLYWLVSAFMAAAAVLVKPTAAFLLSPILYLGIRQLVLRKKLWWFMLLCAAVAVLPLYTWRQWILQFPEGIPVYAWLLNEGNIRLKGAWFYWLFAKRIAELMLGYWGIVFVALGLAVKGVKHEMAIFYGWLIGGLAYLIIFARGNVQHDYYQVIILPVICIALAKGVGFLLTKQTGISRIPAYGIVMLCSGFMLAFSWYTVRTYYWINRPEIVEAGKAADALLPPDAKVIASYNGDTTFLYQTNRQGWPLGFEIDKKIAAGATHYVTVSPSDSDGETRALISEYTVIVRNDKFAIIDLRYPNKLKHLPVEQN